MLIKKIAYVDYDEVPRTETFFFNLTKFELVELEVSADGGLTAKIKRIAEKVQDGDLSGSNPREIMATFKELIEKSVGEKSPDGKRFVKSKAITEAFLQSPAFDVLFEELTTDAKAGAAFINALVKRPGDSVNN